ncbi:MAG: PAS domain S-box protein [Bacteroidales bacterium]|nr:PAS domain S-box protein [Bacteroidales bacterium]
MRHIKLLLSFLLGGFTIAVSGQELKYRSDMITRDDGLSNSVVTCITKDRYGFMWFGTWNGLNRYDGYELKIFHHNPEDSNSLSNGNINIIFGDKEGDLWIGTDYGLNCYKQLTGSFRRYTFDEADFATRNINEINGITQDAEGTIWVGSMGEGITGLNKSTGAYHHFRNSYSVRSNNVNTLLVDNLFDKYLWIGASDGLYRFNIEAKRYEKISGGDLKDGVSVQAILQDENGNLFLGTWGSGLIKMDRKTNKFTFFNAGKNDPENLRNSMIQTMALQDRNHLVLNVWGRGLIRYNIADGSIDNLDNESIQADLKNKMITSVYTDPIGILWTGTLHEGIIKIVPIINSFNHYSASRNDQVFRNRGGVAAVIEDSKGYLWLGTRIGGLIRINRKTQEHKIFNQVNGPISSNSILSLLETVENKEQVIWIGTDRGGLNRLEPATGKIRIYKRQDEIGAGPSSNSISSIVQYDRDHLLLGTRERDKGEGLDIFNLRTGKFVNLRYVCGDSTSLGSDDVNRIFKDKLGKVWVGTRNGGLNEFVIKDIDAAKPEDIGYFIRYINDPDNPQSLNNNTVYAIFDDADNNLWVGTNGGGLSKFNRKQNVFSPGPAHEYLNDNIIYGILGDDHGNLWISTSRGIIVFNPESARIHRFDKYKGIKENAFIYGSYFRSASGEMFFGGIEGCHSFYPDSIRINLRVPQITITSLSFSGKKGLKSVAEITGKSVMASRHVELPYNQNNFSVTFSSLDYNMPAQNRYKYMLEGYDEDWIATDASRRYVNYTNLAPGKYLFRVIGSNSDNIWNHEGTTLTILIKPPIWATTLFRMLMVLLVAGILSYVFYSILKKYRLEKLKVEKDAQESLQDERKQLRTLIDCMPDLIFIKDRESRFTVANKKVAQVMGTTPENLIGKTDFDFYEPDLAQSFYEDEQNIIRTGESMINHEETAFDEFGNRTIIATTKVPMKNREGEIIGVVGICRDITKLKRIERELRKKSEDLQETNELLEGRQREILQQSEELASQTQHLQMVNTELEHLNRTKDKLFSIIAHDLRNPFNAIMGFSKLLKEDYDEMDNMQQKNVLDLINVSSQTAFNLLENLLQWARTQTNKIAFQPENFDLSETATSAIELHSALAIKKGITLKNEIEQETLVYGDKNMIDAVLRNLISNAIKFSHPEGRIIVSANKTGDNFEIAVEDDGIGMDQECLSKLFRADTFFSTAGTRGESGTGLGLILCKEFVERNNGRIKAKSKEGAGTTLSFTLNPAKRN